MIIVFRTQFVDPNLGDAAHEPVKDKEFYEKSSDEDDDDEGDEKSTSVDMSSKPAYKMDPDHRLLLRSTKPLLQVEKKEPLVVKNCHLLFLYLVPQCQCGDVCGAVVLASRSACRGPRGGQVHGEAVEVPQRGSGYCPQLRCCHDHPVFGTLQDVRAVSQTVLHSRQRSPPR